LHPAAESWRIFLFRSFEERLRRHRDALGYPAAWERELAGCFPEWLAEVPDTIAPVFLHGDFHYDNLLFEPAQGRWRISGLFDLEWAWAGEAAFDLLHLEEAFALYPEDEPPFREGYEIPCLPSERLRVYRVLHALRVLHAALSHRPDPLWDLLARHGVILKNLIAGKSPFADG
jgi:Ser/Thr protein kinase RdoA (MazF antagonist)